MTTSIQLFMIYMTSKLPQTSARHPQNDQDTHRYPQILQKQCLCLGVSELYLGVSAWGLRVSGDELMQNILAQIYIGHVRLDNAFYSSAC